MSPSLPHQVEEVAVVAASLDAACELSAQLVAGGLHTRLHTWQTELPELLAAEPPAGLVLCLDAAEPAWAYRLLATLREQIWLPVLAVGEQLPVTQQRRLLQAGTWAYLPRELAGSLAAATLERHLELAQVLRGQQASIERLTQMSLTDDVTGLYNQRYLFRRLEQEYQRALRYGHPLAVLMLDIDDFKGVNDTSDHLFGSHVLRELGQLLARTLRKADVLVRYGGDEFTVLLPEIGLDNALRAAERLRLAVEQHCFQDARRCIRISVSIGVAAHPDHASNDGAGLLRLADTGLYLAKQGGRNRCALPEPQPAAVAG